MKSCEEAGCQRASFPLRFGCNGADDLHENSFHPQENKVGFCLELCDRLKRQAFLPQIESVNYVRKTSVKWKVLIMRQILKQGQLNFLQIQDLNATDVKMID